MDVIVVLSGIVEEGLVLAECAFDHFLDRLVLPLCSFGEVVSGGDVSLMMLVVVKLERFARHVGRKRVVGVRQVRQGKCHWSSPQLKPKGAGASVKPAREHKVSVK